MTTKQLEEEALTLKSIDRIHLVEKLLISLNRPDPKMEKEWVLESEARYKAYKHGEIEPVSLQHIRNTHS
ncbi:MAG TPA: addiction module protein [Spirochaetota bacterium]|nr:addiction module protein [Spirochaetota bacterium]HPH03212.1 addiction module protein [Spirochaetota bacterium]